MGLLEDDDDEVVRGALSMCVSSLTGGSESNALRVRKRERERKRAREQERREQERKREKESKREKERKREREKESKRAREKESKREREQESKRAREHTRFWHYGRILRRWYKLLFSGVLKAFLMKKK